MRVAFITRLNLYTIAGGDTVQIEQTARQLIALGVEVDILRSIDVIPYEKYDLLHSKTFEFGNQPEEQQ